MEQAGPSGIHKQIEDAPERPPPHTPQRRMHPIPPPPEQTRLEQLETTVCNLNESMNHITVLLNEVLKSNVRDKGTRKAFTNQEIDEEIERMRNEEYETEEENVNSRRGKHSIRFADEYEHPPIQSSSTFVPANTRRSLLDFRERENITENSRRRDNSNQNRTPRLTHTVPSREVFNIISRMPFFDGFPSQNLDHFLEHIKDTLNITEPEDRNYFLAHIITTKIRGRARNDVRARNIQTYEQLDNLLRSIYKPVKTRAVIQGEINRTIQRKNEDAKTFGDRLIKLLNELVTVSVNAGDSAETTERVWSLAHEEVLLQFKTGLNKELGLIVKASHPKTLQEAVQIAVEEELADRQKKEIRIPETPRRTYIKYNYKNSNYCTNCKKPGHFIQSCWFAQGQQNSPRNGRNTNTNVRELENENTRTSDYVEIKIKETKNELNTMLIDTGAEVSLIKKGSLKENVEILPESTELMVANGEKLYTVGKINITMEANNKQVKHLMHIIEDNTIPLPAEGVLGCNFYTRQKW